MQKKFQYSRERRSEARGDILSSSLSAVSRSVYVFLLIFSLFTFTLCEIKRMKGHARAFYIPRIYHFVFEGVRALGASIRASFQFHGVNELS